MWHGTRFSFCKWHPLLVDFTLWTWRVVFFCIGFSLQIQLSSLKLIELMTKNHLISLHDRFINTQVKVQTILRLLFLLVPVWARKYLGKLREESFFFHVHVVPILESFIWVEYLIPPSGASFVFYVCGSLLFPRLLRSDFLVED